jgi:hypothetical protein
MAFLNPLRFSLEPGHFIKIGEESLLLFQQENGGLMEPKTEGKFFRIPKQGAYQLLVEARFEEDDLAAEDGRVINVAPKGQWRGRLDASLHSLEITSDGMGVPPVSHDAPATGPTPDPSKCEPSPSSNAPSAKADGRDAHATKPSATGR